jgi:hypothetical protein
METLVYVIWFSFPAIFYIMALWAQLEKWGGRSNQGDAIKIYIKQGSFVLGCVLLCILIDKTILDEIVASYLDPYITRGLARFLLFPLILLLVAQIFGGSKPVQLQSKRINKANRRKR